MATTPHFYHGLIRKHVIAFGSLFDDITVHRERDGELIQRLAVPITYGPTRAWRTRLTSDPDLNKPVSITLPFMGYEIVGYTYAVSYTHLTLPTNREV